MAFISANYFATKDKSDFIQATLCKAVMQSSCVCVPLPTVEILAIKNVFLLWYVCRFLFDCTPNRYSPECNKDLCGQVGVHDI